MPASARTSCPRRLACRQPRLARRAHASRALRLAVFAIAVAALSVMSYGERWVLDQPIAFTNELAVATCAFDVVYGGIHPASGCTSSAGNEKGNSL